MSRSQQSFGHRNSPVMFIIGAVLVVASLSLAREVLMPLALAALLSFVLGPFVSRLESLKLGRIPSVIIVVLISFGILAGLGWIFTSQLTDLGPHIPKYTENLKARIRELKPSGDGIFSVVRRTVKEMGKEIQPPPVDPASARPPEERGQNIDRPLWVREADAPTSAAELLLAALAPILSPLATAGIVVVFVFFILVRREDLRDRLIRLIGEHQLSVTTEALDDAASKVSKYLLMQVVVNTIFGIATAIGLSIIGIPSAILWGVICAALRFVPYVGSWMGAFLPLAVALAISPGWSQPISVLAFFAILEISIGNFLEPMVFGRTTGVSALAILVAAVFWTWVWGGIGLLLSTPLTVCVVVLGKYVPQLEFLSILLGDEPALKAHVRFYQRLLASDQEEAIDAMHEVLKTKSLPDFYLDLAIPTAALLEQDKHRGDIDESKATALYASFRDLIEEAEEYSSRLEAAASRSDPTATGRPAASSTPQKATIVFVPAYDEGDEISAIIFSKMLGHRGFSSEVVSASNFVNERAETAQTHEADVVIVSALPPSAATHAKYLLRQLRSKNPAAKIIVGIWSDAKELERAKDRFTPQPDLSIVATFEEMLEKVVEAESILSLQKQA